MAKIRKVKSKAGRPSRAWPKEKVALLKKLYPTNDNESVAKELGVSVSALRNAAVKFRVKKSIWYWDKPEENFLLKNWPAMSAIELSEKLGKTKWSVINKYRELTGMR